jgi:hypothetical protein
MRIRRAPGRGRRFTPPPAYDEIDLVPNADIPIARHVAADPLPASAAPQLNPEHHDAHGLPDSPESDRPPLPKRDGPAKDSTNISPPPNPPLRASPQPSNPEQAPPSARTPWLLRPLPLPLPQPRPLPRPLPLLPHPPLQ